MTIDQLPNNTLDNLTPTGSNMRRRLVESVNQITKAPVWIAPTLLNSWVNFGSGWSDAGYYRDALGRVHLRGFVKDGTVSYPTAMFALPEGYRPIQNLRFICDASDATETDEVPGFIAVLPDGSVAPFTGGAATFATGAYISLDGISFLAEQ